ncbi:MAG: beta-lactamase family protein [Methylobacterium sp.]|uniref:serine hydrolase domain-containing protein n=1 Tax=Methylobacterium sp. TaxID=409 RepID=UPI0025856344|nr:serine hydrolase domain-containing protein [Methylobacterium sp.]MBY0296590.1 beta-lactamase family protein [Methylobacterium sp.]
MRGQTRRAAIGAVALLWALAVPAGAEVMQRAKPEEAGLSSERLARIAPAFEAEIREGRIPGAVVMVARRGRLVYAQAFGAQDKAAGKPMTTDAIFRAYSMTKAMTSVGAMMLVEEGRIQLTDPVAKYLPEFKTLQVSVPKADGMGQASFGTVPADRAPTIQDLLRHTAGLAYGEITGNAPVKGAYAQAGLYTPGADYAAIELDSEAFTKRIAGAPLAHQPGTTWEYSLATDVLGRVIEKVSGQRLSAFLDARLFRPLGMSDTGFSLPAEKMGRLAQAFPTDPATGNPNRVIDVSAPPKNDSGGAGAVTTAADYLRFCQMLLNGGEIDGTRLLSRTTVALMTADHLPPAIRQTVQPGEQLLGVQGYTFGLGFAVRREQGLAGVHGSAGEYTWAGYAGTYFWVDPKEQLVGILMTQAPGPSRPYYRRLVRGLVYQAIAD